MKPHIICHMLSSVDGKIDGAALDAVTGEGEYEATGVKLEGGGHINGAFLQADLVDEVSLLLVPGIDGRHDIPAVFDGVNPARNTAVPLKLKSVEQRANDTLWIRYAVVRSQMASLKSE